MEHIIVHKEEMGQALTFDGVTWNVDVDESTVKVNDSGKLESVGGLATATFDSATNALTLAVVGGDDITVDLSSLLDDTSISSGVLNAEGICTLTKTDGSTVDVDMSSLIDDMTLSVENSESINLQLSDTDVLTADVKIDTSEDNRLSIGEDGLLVEPVTSTLAVGDESLDLSIDGTDTSLDLIVLKDTRGNTLGKIFA